MSQKWNQIEDLINGHNDDDNNGHNDHPSAEVPQLIAELKRRPNLFGTIVASFCPQILGYGSVKRGLVLSLFSGLAKHDRDTRKVSVSPQINVLIFGNHGSQKNELLKAICEISPDDKYEVGNVVNGLLSLTDKRSGSLISKEFAVCCIDEFEKMNGRQYLPIREVLDHQMVAQISEGTKGRAKDRKFYNRFHECQNYRPTKTAVVTAINPRAGEYEPSLNVWQNTKLSRSLLSKFDLIFNLVDCPDDTKDIELANRILKVTKGFEEDNGLISAEELRQLIIYAQKYIKPILGKEAEEAVRGLCQEFSVNSINKSQKQNYESMCLLIEARARAELEDVATKAHFDDVFDILKHSEGKHYLHNDYIATATAGRRNSKSKRAKMLIKTFEELAERDQKEFTVDEISELCAKYRLGFGSKTEVLEAIDTLNEYGHLIRTAQGVYRFVP